MQHIKSVLPPSLDPFQFAYRSNRSTDDAIATALHPALTHLDKTDTYVRLLFIDFKFSIQHNHPSKTSSSINWSSWGSICRCATGCWTFLTGRPQAVRVGSNTSAPSHWTQGPPPKDVCWAPSSSLCWPTTAHRHTTPTASLNLRMGHDCGGSHQQQRWDKTTGARLSRLAGWCSDNNLSLNVEKTKEIVVDFRRVHSLHAPLTINGATVERVSSTKFPGCTHHRGPLLDQQHCSTSQESTTASLLPRKLRRARAPAPIMCTFYRGTIESILTSCITVWYGACNASCRKSLQRIVRAAEKIAVSLSPPSRTFTTPVSPAKPSALQVIPPTRHTTSSVCYHQGGDWGVSKPGQNRLKDSFIHQAVRKLNSLPSLPPLPSLTPRITELWPPPHHHQPTRNTHTHTTHTHTHTETSTGPLVQHWTDLIQLPLLTVWTKKTAPCHFK